MNIIDAMNDPELFGKTFRRRLIGGDTWKAWKSFLSALFALPMDSEAKKIFEAHSGRLDAPSAPFNEAFVVCGRRSGKSVVAAITAVFIACFRDYSEILAPGETGTLMVIAADRRQARVIFGYIVAFLQAPILKAMVKQQLKESITLANNVTIEIATCSYRATRGYSLVGVVADELAYWSDDNSANPAEEVLAALRPGLATTGGLLLGISSPYAKRGPLWNAYREHYGKNDSEVLVWKAASREMNPTLSRAVVAAAYLRDAASARAEYGAEFRTDVENFLSFELLESRVIRGRRELPRDNAIHYCAFTDPSGGQSDSFTLAIAHSERDRAVLDLLREIPAPFSPENAVTEFAQTLKNFGISTVVGDHYAGSWPREQFAKRGIEYKTSDKTRSELYLELLPAISSGQVDLLDNAKLVAQLCGLERRTARSGRDSIDHAPGAHDDLANVGAGALLLALNSTGAALGLINWQQAEVSGANLELAKQQKASLKELIFQAEMKIRGLKTWHPTFNEVCVPHPEQHREPSFHTPVPVVKPMQSEPCAVCGSGLVRGVGGGGNRCGQCGAQSFPRGRPPITSTTRAEWLKNRSSGGARR